MFDKIFFSICLILVIRHTFLTFKTGKYSFGRHTWRREFDKRTEPQQFIVGVIFNSMILVALIITVYGFFVVIPNVNVN